MGGSDQEVNSEPLKKIFTTKPLAASNFKLLPESEEISWTRSATPRVHSYKVRWKGEEGRAAEEVIVPVLDEANPVCTFRIKDLVDGILYKVNITALVEDCRVTDSKGQESARMSVESSSFAESKALHEKLILIDGSLTVHVDEASELLERQTSV